VCVRRAGAIPRPPTVLMPLRIWIARRLEKLIAIVLQRRVMIITEFPLFRSHDHFIRRVPEFEVFEVRK